MLKISIFAFLYFSAIEVTILTIPILLTFFLAAGSLLSLVIILKRIRNNTTSPKEILTGVCFFLIAANGLLSYWLKYPGLVSWFINIVLLILGAYFTKYLPKSEKNDEEIK